MKKLLAVAGLILGALVVYLIYQVPGRSDSTAISAATPRQTPSTNGGKASPSLAPSDGERAGVRGSPAPPSGSSSNLQSAAGSTTERRSWDPGFLQGLYHASAGTSVGFELVGGQQARGTLRHLERKEGEVIYVAGDLTAPEAGRFFFQKQTLPGKAGEYAGVVEFPGSKTGYRLEPGGLGSGMQLVKMPLGQVVCLALPLPETGSALSEGIPPLDPSDFPDYSIPDYQEGIIPLQSLPGAAGVLYIDYRGGYTPTWGGISYTRPDVNNAQIRDVWKRVAEDFIPFDINVTTDLRVYQNAPENSRQRCVVTPTSTAAPGAGGVAYIGSWNWTGDTPCWVFMVSGKGCAEAISHEVGHTLSLGHDGQSPSTEYYGGQGSGEVGWAPIMGVGYYQNVSQWCKGEYQNANNTEDDLGRIVGNNNAVAYRTDDTGATLATSRYLEVYPNNSALAEGVIERTGDTDAFQFTTTGGAISLRANPVGDWGNLAIQATLCNAADVVIASNNPQSTLWAAINTSVPAGTYTFRVTGAGRNDVLTTGFSAYSSIGYYSITGTVANARQPIRFVLAENSPNGTLVGVIPPSSSVPPGSPLVYRIISGNTANAFGLNNAGSLFVSTSSALNYEALARTNQLPVQFELFVNITNLANPALTELNRRVVVTITDVNEAPTLASFSTNVLEHTQPGTLLATVAAADPDFYNLLSYAIVGGDTNGMFSIGPQSGEIRVAGDLSRAVQSAYQLQVRVSDQVGPQPLMATSIVNIAVLANPTPFSPGGIAYALYTNLSGTAVSALTGTAVFPTDPASEKVLSCFEGERNQGDNYGSVMRGYLIAPASGTYTFWIASDDNGELWMSSSTNPAAMARIAYISGSGWTGPREWNKFSTQKSAPRTLTAGQAYYIEARHKEGSGDDNLAVAWTGPGWSGTNVIPGLFLAPYSINYVPHATGFTGTLRRDAFAGTRLGRVGVTDVNRGDTNSFSILSGNSAGLFTIDSDGWVQLADAAALQTQPAGQTYSLSVRVTDSGSPPLSASTTVGLTLVETNTLLPTTVQREMFYNIGGGTAVSDLTSNARFPALADELRPLSQFSTPADIADNYGSRIRAYVIPPVSGDYRFFIASDDSSQLKLSANDNSATAVVIASVNGWTGTNEWTKQASQVSALRTGLVAGQRYYLEALHKEGGGGDHLAVAWAGPGVAGTNVIDGSCLAPVDLNYAPQINNQTLGVIASAPNGTFVGAVAATDNPLDTLTFQMLAGNLNNTFALDPASGGLRVSDNTLLTNGASFVLTIAVQDSGCGGLYPLRSAQATVTVTVLGAGGPLVWTGAGAANQWGRPENWRGAAPGPGARLIFGFAAQQTNFNDSVNALGWVQFTNGGFSLSGAPVSVQAGITNSGNNTWALATTLAGAQSWHNSSGTWNVSGPITNAGYTLGLVANGDVRLSGPLSGTGGLSKSGTGRLLLQGSHPYTGATVVASAGSSATALEVSGTEDLDLSGSDLTMNGRMDLWNHNAIVGALNGNGTIFANDLTRALIVGANHHSGSFSGLLTNSSWSSAARLALVKTGTGSQTLSGANTFSGGTVIRAGQINLLHGLGLGAGTATLGDMGSGTNAVSLVAAAAVTITNPITVSSSTSIPSSTLGTANFNANGVNTTFSGPLSLNREVVLQAGSTDRTTFAAPITGAGAVTITSPFGAGRRVVFDRPSGASNTFGGGLSLSTNAWLQLGATSSLGNRTVPDAAVVQFAPGAQLRLAPAGSGDSELIGGLNSAVANAGVVDLISSALFTLQIGGGDAGGQFGGSLLNSAGSLALSKVGAGRQVLAGASSFSGLLSISGGRLVAAHAAALGSSVGGTSVSPGASLALSNSITLAVEPLTLNGAGVPAGSGALLNESGTNAFNGPITLAGPATVGAAEGNLTVAGSWNTGGNPVTFNAAAQANIVVLSPIGGAGGLVKSGPGLLLLSGSNTFSGTTLLLEGTLDAAGSLAGSSNLILMANATLKVPGGWTLAPAQTLQGEGNVDGSALIQGTLQPGGVVGRLTFLGDTTLSGRTLMEIGRAGTSLTNDQLVCGATLQLGGTLTVTNLGPDPLLAGDSFKLFTAAGFGAGGFTTLELPLLAPGLFWDTSTLPADGTLRILAEPSEPPRLSLAAGTGTLTLSWPTNYWSYVLQAQTNAPGQGLGATWYPVPGLSNNTLSLPLDVQQGSVFYRLARP